MNKKTTALLLNFLAIFCWAISPVAIRYVKEVFPVNTQNFFRYLVSLVIIWSVLRTAFFCCIPLLDHYSIRAA